MAQPGSSLNLLIHDASGQQQVYKVMQSGQGKPLTSASVKAIVKDFSNQGQNSPQIIRTINGQKLFGVQPGSKVVTLTGLQSKAIRLTPEQMSAFKIVQRPVSTPQKNIQVTNSVNTPLNNTSNIAGTNKKIASSSSHHNTVQSTISRRRKTDKVGKGLRHFSMKVCEKVKEKGTTTYNEVADELVAEEIEGNQPIDPANYDQKNIRRRVYDALNVLMAMNIISKEKKEIRWIGLPTNSAQQCNNLEKENEKRRERIETKQQQLRELILQQVSFKSLVTRNKEGEERGLIPTPSSAIQLPFIIVNTTKKTNINCSISNDKSEYFIKFDDKFEIHDDVEVLKKMGLLLGLDKGECTYDDIERAKTMVPKAFEKYIEIYGKGLEDNLSDYDMSNSELIDINQTTRTTDHDSDSCDVDDDEEDPASDVSDAD